MLTNDTCQSDFLCSFITVLFHIKRKKTIKNCFLYRLRLWIMNFTTLARSCSTSWAIPALFSEDVFYTLLSPCQMFFILLIVLCISHYTNHLTHFSEKNLSDYNPVNWSWNGHGDHSRLSLSEFYEHDLGHACAQFGVFLVTGYTLYLHRIHPQPYRCSRYPREDRGTATVECPTGAGWKKAGSTQIRQVGRFKGAYCRAVARPL